MVAFKGVVCCIEREHGERRVYTVAIPGALYIVTLPNGTLSLFGNTGFPYRARPGTEVNVGFMEGERDRLLINGRPYEIVG